MNRLTECIASGRCYVIAEAGLNHNGSLDIALQLIDVAAAAGADCVKFQKRTVSKLATEAVLDAKDERFPEFGKTYREIREHLEFSLDEYRQLKARAESKDIDFMVTAFDTDAVEFLEQLGVDTYKIASHSLTNLGLLARLAQTRKPLVLSTGMADLAEIDTAVEILRGSETGPVLMHCVSAYPTPTAECNLSMIELLKARYNVPVGYSGHELGYFPSLVAVAMGAQLIERHHTLDKKMVGFDHKISLDPGELTEMIRQIREIPALKGSGVKEVSEKEWVTRRKYHVSMVSASSIPAGAVLNESMVTWCNPGTGIPPKAASTVYGKRAKQPIPANELLSADMFE